MEKIETILESAHGLLKDTPELELKWRNVQIDGRIISVPAFWSDTAARILATKYMRKDGVPMGDELNIEAVEEDDPNGYLPTWLWPKRPVNAVMFGPETSAHQVFHRIAGHWTYAAWIYGYVETDDQAWKLYAAAYMGLAKQVFAPNSPQWFNTGVWWAYGTEGSSAAYRPLGDLPITVENEKTGEDESVTIPSCHQVGSEAYRYPQTSACFILGVEDNLIDTDGIFETLSREAQIFKYGSGAGANFSKLRHKGAPLSSGGLSAEARARIGAWRSATRCVAVGVRAITQPCMLCHGWPDFCAFGVAVRRDVSIAP